MTETATSSEESVQFSRELFWQEQLPLPAGLRLEHLGTVVVPRRGPGGATIQDEATLESPQGRVQLLVEYRGHLLARDVPGIGERLKHVLQQKRLRELAVGSPATSPLPVVATDLAVPAVQQACLAEGLGLIDRSGTVLLRGPTLFVHVQGKARVLRASRVNPFRGKGTRILRLLLSRHDELWTAQAVAHASDASYAFSHGVLSFLEREGFLRRRSPRSGFRLFNGVGLLKRWMTEDDASAVVTERFNAPSTEAAVLREGSEVLSARGIRSIFTLASALLPSEVFSTALPHGIYVSGDASSAIVKLGLRRITPYNFFVLKPHPSVDTEAGGVYFAPRTFPHGQGVFLPQLVLDFNRAGGRGPEQAKELLEGFAEELPYAEEPR